MASSRKRLLPHIVDERARTGYDKPYALYPHSKNPSQGFRAVSYAQLANAVNRAAWWLESKISGDEEKQYPVAYLGPNDLRYIIFVLATMKTGRKLLFPSLRNTVDAQLSLFEKLNCKVLVTCPSLNHSLQSLLAAPTNIRKVLAPSLDALLDEEQTPHYSYDQTHEGSSKEPFLFAHTSGSSGNPKPIGWNMAFINALDSIHLLPTSQGPSLLKAFTTNQRNLILLPCFHAGGLAFNFYAVFFNMTLVLGHPDVPISASYVSQLLNQGVITAMLSPPSILDELSKDPFSIPDLAKLEHVGYGGGPLHPTTGNALAPQVKHLFSIIGATEYGWFHLSGGESSRWDSLHFYERIGYRFDEVSPSTFELIIVKDPTTDHFHGIFEVFPSIPEYRTRDLYSPPSPSGWRTYKGRTDDLIILSNGEKINPIPLETHIQTHPLVRAALVVGTHQFNPSLLLELEPHSTPTTSEQKHTHLNAIWPTVQSANKSAPEFSQIPKSLILFATPSKPFSRAAKGTVQRQNTIKAYTAELAQLFTSQEDDILIEGLTLGNYSQVNEDTIRVFTREIYTQALGAKDLRDDEDVFERGMDSLHVEVVVKRLRAALKAVEAGIEGEEVDTKLVYGVGCVDDMVGALLGIISRRKGSRKGISSKL